MLHFMQRVCSNKTQYPYQLLYCLFVYNLVFQGLKTPTHTLAEVLFKLPVNYFIIITVNPSEQNLAIIIINNILAIINNRQGFNS